MDTGPVDPLSRASLPQLRRLLSLAATREGQSGWTTGRRPNMAIIRARLAELCGTGPSGTVDPLTAVCSPSTPIATLRALKATSKRFAGTARSDEDRWAATLLYHASVAAAFAFHAEAISSRSVSDLWLLYEELAEAFGGEPLGEVFSGALRRLASSQV